VFILGLGLFQNTYAPSPPTPPSQANLAITTEINSNTVTDGLIIQNQNYNYTITVTNSGPASASDVEVVTILPSQLSVANVNATCSLSSQTETCDLGTIVSGGTKIIELEVTPGSLGGVIQKSNVTSSTFDKTPQGFAFSKIFKSITSINGVAVDSSNNVYTTDTQIRKYDIHGTLLNTGSTSWVGSPTKIDFDTDGNVFVTDRTESLSRRIAKLNPNLSEINPNFITSGLTAGTMGIAVNSTNHIFATIMNNDEFRIANSAGTVLQVVPVTSADDDTDTNGPRGIAVNGSRIIVVDRDPDEGSVEIFDLSGNNVGEIGVGSGQTCNSDGRLSNPDSVEIDDAGNIYIGSYSCGTVQAYDSNLNSIFHYGVSVTSGVDALLNRVVSIALNGTGWLYAADESDNKVILLQPIAGVSKSLPGTVLSSTPSGGDFIQSITEVTATNGIVGQSFTFAAHVDTNSAGEIFVADNPSVISKFTSDGVFSSNIITGLTDVDDVIIDSNGRILATDQTHATVRVYSATDSLELTLGTATTTTPDDTTHFLNPHGVAVDSSNNIYVVDKGHDKIKIYSSTGTHLKTMDGVTEGGTLFDDPVGVAIDSTGRIIVSDFGTQNNIQIFEASPSYAFVTKITDADGAGGTFNNPHKVAVDSHDRIYTVDNVNKRVQIFDSTGAFVQSITDADGAGTAFNDPSGLSVDSNGKIYVADGNKVQIFKALDAPVTETTSTVAASVASDSSDSSQEKAEAAAAKPDESFALPEEEYNEVVAESLATPISAPVEVPVEESFEAVSAPEKVEAAPEDTSFKVLTKVLSKSDDKEDDAKKLGLEYKDGDVRALVILDETSDAVINEIKKYANIESINKDLIQINIPIDDLSTLYKIPDITKVQPTSKAIQSAFYGEGYKTIHANIPHELGIKGDGIKIAILDLAFDDTNDEMKNNIAETKSFRHDFDGLKIPLEGFGSELIHGTAVAEIVIDITPNSELFLYTFASEVEFLDAMDYSISQDVDLITMSAGWVNYPTDGNSEMTKKVEQAIDAGIPFVVSAGNYAETHWEGNYVDANENGWHEFEGLDEGISVVATQDRVDKQIPFILYLMWDSPSDTINDFDLSLTDEDGAEVAYSANLQETANAINFEYVYFTPEKPGTYSLGVKYGSSETSDAILEIFSPSDKLEYQIAEGSVSVPTDAAGIISVGAINYYDSRLEPFSSQGPTNNCISSPSLVAPDAVTTTAYGNTPFFGTSAAAPHVAGMVALMIDKIPQLTPLQILSELKMYSDTDFDSYINLQNMFGSGLADSKFIAELDEIVHVTEMENGCTSGNSIGDFRDGNSDQQSKFAVGGLIVQQGVILDDVTPEVIIPQWIKSNAGWWANDTVTDETFVNALEFLIEQEIINMPKTVNVSEAPKDKTKHEFETVEETIPIPDWIKNNAAWWSEDAISNETFIDSIEYLINQKIIDVN
jgi:uncharacterized repeat protein (TIGR01451 family)